MTDVICQNKDAAAVGSEKFLRPENHFFYHRRRFYFFYLDITNLVAVKFLLSTTGFPLRRLPWFEPTITSSCAGILNIPLTRPRS
ncbi:MAG: hypothetical protein MI923_24595 [Phycisphaerales bacterium]|nr:hypothetical protein [Phycisphaerales bacterium]